MAAISFPLSNRSLDVGRAAGLFFLAVGAFDGVVLGLLSALWVLAPDAAPSFRTVVAAPVLALLVISAAPSVRRAVGTDRASLVLSSTARWWSMFAVLMAIPALLIQTAA